MKGLNCGPWGRGCGPSGPYLTAYDIARKHGYQGSEEDWIRSIGQWKVIRAEMGTGTAFSCDTPLSDVFAALEHGIVPVMIFGDRVLAFPTEVGDDYIGFGTLMYREGGTDKYDVYTMSRRGNTVQTRTVSGGEGGEGWAPGNNSIEYMWLEESVRGSLDKAESAVQPEEMAEAIAEALAGLEPGGSGSDVINLANNGIGYAVSPQQLDTTARTAALEGYQLRRNGLVAVRFGSAVEGPNPTLNINGTFNVPMYHNGSALNGGEIRAGETALFVFDGTNYNLLCVDSANQNYGSANAGKPVVVGQDGSGTVGSWPVPGEGGEPVTWPDIVPAGGILQTDIAKLTVEFTEENGVFTSSANLTAVLAALATHTAVDCAMGDYRGELIYAHADSEDTSEEFAIFKITEQVAVYQGQDGEERFPQVRMIYMTHVGASYQLEAIGGRCYVYVTENNGVYDIDTTATSKIARSILGLLTAFYAGIETRMIVNDGYYNWSHPVSFHYAQAEICFAGPEAVTVNGRTEIRMVEYKINSSSHVWRTVGSTLPVPASGDPNGPSADKDKIVAVNEYGQYMLTDRELPSASASDAGKVLTVGATGAAGWQTPGEKILTMTQAGTTYTYTGANFTFSTLADLQALVSAGTILWLVNLTTGSAYRSVNSRGASSVARLTFAGVTLESDNDTLAVEAFILNGQMQITKTGGIVVPKPQAAQVGYTIVADANGGATWTLPEAAAGADGLSPQLKNALLQFAAAAAGLAQSGPEAQAIYQNLYDALYPQSEPAELVSISASYSQNGATVYDNASLDSLKASLVVTAHYDDNTTETVQGYTLSGTLTAGTSTVTVTYEGLTTTFSVTVTQHPPLDDIAYGTTTYRQMFIENNLCFLGDFEQGLTPALAPSSASPIYVATGEKYYINSGTPTITTEAASSPTHSLKAFGSGSHQLGVVYEASAGNHTLAAGKYFIGACVKCDRYEAGRLGLYFKTPPDGTAAATARAVTEQVTSGFEAVGAIVELESAGSGWLYYCGSMSSANLDGYVDDVVCVPIPSDMTEQAAMTLYEHYLEIVGGDS